MVCSDLICILLRSGWVCCICGTFVLLPGIRLFDRSPMFVHSFCSWGVSFYCCWMLACCSLYMVLGVLLFYWNRGSLRLIFLRSFPRVRRKRFGEGRIVVLNVWLVGFWFLALCWLLIRGPFLGWVSFLSSFCISWSVMFAVSMSRKNSSSRRASWHC